MHPIWFLRMAQWVRNPPSMRTVLIVLAVIAACITLFVIERFVGWPAWLTPDHVPRGRI